MRQILSQKNLTMSAHAALLALLSVVPVAIFALYELFHISVSTREHLEQMTRVDAGNVASLVERELAGELASLQALALSPELQAGDLRGFHSRAMEFLALSGVNIVLRDMAGQQLINTRVPWGTPLPKGADISATDREAIKTRSGRVTNLFIGAVVHAPLYMVELPIITDGKAPLLLGMSLPTSKLNEVIGDVSLPEGRWITIIDGNGVVLARTLSDQTIVGRSVLPPAVEAIAAATPSASTIMTSPEGIRNFAAFHKIDHTPWTAAVAVREDIVMAPLRKTLLQTLALATTAICVTTTIAFAYRRFLQRGATALSQFANELGVNQVGACRPSGIKDLDTVSTKLSEIGRELTFHEDTHQKLLAALGKAPVFVRGLDGRIQFWGEGACQLYGFSSDEAIGQISHELLDTTFPKDLDKINKTFLANGHWKGLLKHKRKTGDIVNIESSWECWRHPISGEPVAIVETNVDVTARMAQMAAEEANRAKSAFLGAISHDLRQPFQAVRLFQQVLESQASGPMANVVGHMGNALTSAEEMLGAMSELSVMEAGKVEAKLSCFNVGEVLGEIVEDCAALAASAGLQLRHVPSSAVIETDRILFKRMLRNLVVNAIRYTRKGGVLIGCRRRAGGLAVQVVDTGIGIPDSQLAHIFEAFYQVGDEPQNGSRGLGLGLAIVSKLSCLLRLPVNVASRRDKGSAFTITVRFAGGTHHSLLGDRPRHPLAMSMPPVGEANCSG